LHFLLSLWRSFCTGTSVAGAQRAQRAGVLRGFLVAEGSSTRAVARLDASLGSHRALQACGVFLVAFRVRGPLVFSSCLPQQPPGHPCDPTSYSASIPPRGGFPCSWRDVSTPARCPSLCSASLDPTVYALVKGETISPSAARRKKAGRPRSCPTQGGLVRATLASRLCSLRGTIKETQAFSRISLCRSPWVCQSRGMLPPDCH